jgi:hypothetical protein
MKKSLIKNIIFAVIILVVAIILTLTLKYSEEGNKNLPFVLNKITIVSTAEADTTKTTSDKFIVDVYQKNDLFFDISRSESSNNDVSIKSITFDNIKTTKPPKIGEVRFYKPTDKKELYSYTDEFRFENQIVYNGKLETNIPSLEISNNGGTMTFSVGIGGIGTKELAAETEIIHNGKLLELCGISLEDVKFTINFDMIVEMSNKLKYKSNISLNLPSGNIVEEGVVTKEDNIMQDIVFRRSE